MYYTDEYKFREEGDQKFVNEFLVCSTIGKGAYSKVKRVVRFEHGSATIEKLKAFQQSQQDGNEGTEFDADEIAEFAMKVMHKPTLKRERAIRYDEKGEMQMINNLDKVYNEIEIWTQLNHPYIAKLYELIDDDNHDYLYLIIELANLGQIANWDFKQERYIRNETIFGFVTNYLEENLGHSLAEHSKQYS
jgi:serine/threonine protein kinase